MQTFTIIAEQTSTERHTATADSAAAALALFRNGESNLKGDEPGGYSDVIVINDITGEKFTEEQLADVAVAVLHTYPVLLQATGSLRYETSVEAASEEEALKLAAELFNGYTPSYEVNTVNHDFTAHVYDPADDMMNKDAIDIDCREVGEPFSWDAILFLQKLAKLQTLEDEFNAMPEAERPATVGDLDADGDYAFQKMEKLHEMIAEARALLKQPVAPATETEA